MKRQLIAVMAFALLGGFANAQDKKPATTNAPASTNAAASVDDELKKIFPDDKTKFSYAIGMSWGNGMKNRLKSQDMEFDPAVLAKGFADSITGSHTMITEEQESDIFKELRVIMADKRAEKERRQQEAQAAEAKSNLLAGQAFLAKNKMSNGVVTLTNGLQYKILADGSGPSPKLTDKVTVKYKGWLMDGTVFDDSAKHGGESTFNIQGVIKGWTQVLQLMKAGSKWEVYIPPDLAYGEAPHPGIPRNSVLIFDIELVSFGGTPPVIRPPPGVNPLTSDIIKVPSAEEMKKGAKIETIKVEDLKKMTNQ